MSARNWLGLALMCLGLVSCREKSSSEPKRHFILSVSLARGVKANISSGPITYYDGEIVEYSISAMSGYDHLVVMLDGNQVQASGSIKIDGPKQLFASADSIINLPPAAEPSKTEAVRFMIAIDTASAVKAYQSYLADLNELYASNPTKALSLATDAYKRAVEETPDAARQKAEKFLNGKVFNLAPGSAANQTAIKTSIIYINGIFNAIDGAAIALKEIDKVVQSSTAASSSVVYGFYNSGPLFDPNELCITKALAFGSLFKLNECGVSDSDKLEKELSSLIKKGNGELETEANILAKVIMQERGSGRSVILIGHSQGTLLASQALQKIPLDSCSTAISIAGIFGTDSWPKDMYPQVSGNVVAGNWARDVVLMLGKNNFSKVETALTKDADSRIDFMKASNNQLAARFTILLESVKLHSITGSYLASPEIRSGLVFYLNEKAKTLRDRSYCSVDGGVRVYASDAAITSGGLSSSPSRLWIANPRFNGLDTLVGVIRLANGTMPYITDVAESPTGELMGISPDAVFTIDKSSGVAIQLATLDEIFDRTPFLPPAANALAFDRDGGLLVAGRGTPTVYKVKRDLFSVSVVGSFGIDLSSSGDLAVSLGGSIYGVGVNAAGTDYLVRFSPSASVIGQPLGFKNVWGLTFVGNTLFGFTADSATGKGSLLMLDQTTGRGTLVRPLGFAATGSGPTKTP